MISLLMKLQTVLAMFLYFDTETSIFLHQCYYLYYGIKYIPTIVFITLNESGGYFPFRNEKSIYRYTSVLHYIPAVTIKRCGICTPILTQSQIYT